MRRPAPLVLVALVASTTVLSACGGSTTGSTSPSAAAAPGTSAPFSGRLTVLAAASLTGAFTQIGKDFESANPGTTVVFSFGASSTLATQLTQGAPADVFAAASVQNMDQAVAAKAASDPKPFATNVVQIAVPPANPAKIRQLSDLTMPGVKVALCAEAVPCGSVARKVFSNAGLTVTPVTNEPDVKATLSKVQLGEVDAGVVYATDVLAAGSKVKGIAVPADVNASTSYPIAALTGSKNPELAEAFVEYVLSPQGLTTLTKAGFEKP